MFTEGERTEDGYLVHWRRQHRGNVLVAVDDFHGAPLSLVTRAVAAKAQQEREQRRGRGRSYDQVWCVFDQDLHPHVPEALALAAESGIHVVLSNPCIELWFILHYAEQTAHIERGPAQRRSRDLLQCDKVLTGKALSALVDYYADAKRRARALDTKHEGDRSPPRSNPSSNMWELVDQIRS